MKDDSYGIGDRVKLTAEAASHFGTKTAQVQGFTLAKGHPFVPGAKVAHLIVRGEDASRKDRFGRPSYCYGDEIDLPLDCISGKVEGYF